MAWVRRRPLIATLAGLLLLAAACLAGAYFWGRWHYRAALAALRERRFDGARDHARSCLRIWRHSARARILAARVERSAGDYARAEQELEGCKQRHGLSEPLLLEWLLLRAQRGEIDEVAPRLLRRADAGHPEAAEILATLARRYIAELRVAPAEEPLNRWLALEPDSAQALYWRGWVYEQQQRHKAAVEDYQRALEADPSRDVVRLGLIAILLDLNETPSAWEHIEAILARHPDDPKALIAKARCLRLRGEAADTVAVLDGLLARRPDDPVALLQRGMVEMDRGRAAEAEPWLRRASRQLPDDLDVLFSLYRSLAGQPGRAAEAKQVLKQHEQLQEEERRRSTLLNQPSATLLRRPDLAWELGASLLRVKNEDAGLHWLRAALRVDPHHKPTHKTLAAYYARKQDFEKAAEHRRLAEGVAEPTP